MVMMKAETFRDDLIVDYAGLYMMITIIIVADDTTAVVNENDIVAKLVEEC